MQAEKHPLLASLRRLVRFLLVYGLVLAGLLWLMPAAGLFLQARYDALDSAARLTLIVVLLVTAVAWQIAQYRGALRLRRPAPGEVNGSGETSSR
jgi:hypothetical protein